MGINRGDWARRGSTHPASFPTGSRFHRREAEATYRRIIRQPLANSLWLTGIVVALAAFGYGSLNAVSVWDRRQEWGIEGARQAETVALTEMVSALQVETADRIQYCFRSGSTDFQVSGSIPDADLLHRMADSLAARPAR